MKTPQEREKIERQTRLYRDAMPLVVLVGIAVTLFSLSSAVKDGRVCSYYTPPLPVSMDDAPAPMPAMGN